MKNDKNTFCKEHKSHRGFIDILMHQWVLLLLHRAWLFSKSSLARLKEFWNSLICLYETKRKNLFKSTCPTGSFTCPGPSGSEKRRALLQLISIVITKSQQTEEAHALMRLFYLYNANSYTRKDHLYIEIGSSMHVSAYCVVSGSELSRGGGT